MNYVYLRTILPATIAFVTSVFAMSADPIDIGSRRELMVDSHMIESFDGDAELKLHHPVRREVALTFDKPWEGNASGYPTVFQDGDIYRMYYRGHRYVIDDPPFRQAQSEAVCYAESQDGIHWVRPNLGIHRWPGVGTENNIIWMGSPEAHNFAPFKDSNPDCPNEQRYKAVGGTVTSKGLWTFQSADGIHWKRLSQHPVVTKGVFDSHNTVFWDDRHKRYSMYVRDVGDGLRLIAVSHSKDFESWSDPVRLTYPKSAPQQMYTNQILPYHRAPHILMGFPTRYVAKPLSDHVQQLPPVKLRKTLIELDQRVGTDLTDGLFMSSRDGLSFRRWDDAFLRPGPEAERRWLYGDNYQSYGLFETAAPVKGSPNELSMHFDEGVWRNAERRVRRYTIRLDGFVSLNAPYRGGEVTTKPLTFDGTTLNVNYCTSAAGTLRVEILRPDGTPISGFALNDSNELFGDSVDQRVSWGQKTSVGELAGQTVRLRFVLKDGDLYSFQFAK